MTKDEKKRMTAVARAAEYLFFENIALRLVLEHREVANWQKLRGLGERPQDWEWSSFRHYTSGVEGVVEIESQWTARRRELLGEASQVIRRA